MGLLDGRVALVTGVSRRQGIGYAIASRLAGLGADLFVQHHVAHDAEQPWGADSIDEVVAGVGAQALGIDLAEPDAPDRLMAAIPMHNVVPRLSGTPGALRSPAPEIGQHNAEILRSLGYAPDEIDALAQSGVLGRAGAEG